VRATTDADQLRATTLKMMNSKGRERAEYLSYSPKDTWDLIGNFGGMTGREFIEKNNLNILPDDFKGQLEFLFQMAYIEGFWIWTAETSLYKPGILKRESLFRFSKNGNEFVTTWLKLIGETEKDSNKYITPPTITVMKEMMSELLRPLLPIFKGNDGFSDSVLKMAYHSLTKELASGFKRGYLAGIAETGFRG